MDFRLELQWIFVSDTIFHELLGFLEMTAETTGLRAVKPRNGGFGNKPVKPEMVVLD